MSLLCIVSKMPKSQKNNNIPTMPVYWNMYFQYSWFVQEKWRWLSLCRGNNSMCVYVSVCTCVCTSVCTSMCVCLCVCVCQWRVHGDSDWQYVQRQFDGRSTSHQRSTPPTSDCHAGQYTTTTTTHQLCSKYVSKAVVPCQNNIILKNFRLFQRFILTWNHVWNEIK